MVIIADSGSSKCDWLIMENNHSSLSCKSAGLNPFFTDSNHIAKVIAETNKLREVSNRVKQIYFYGAGCSSDPMNKIVQDGLQKSFVNAAIEVEHDLLGAALSTCHNKKGIVCILGTGSNSCYFNGKIACEEVPALGHILGDEGSGAYMGKKLLTSYLYQQLAPEINDHLELRYGLSKELIFSKVYRESLPNRFLASFAPVLLQFENDPLILKIITDSINDFIDIHIMCYDNPQDVDIHFVGSIAYYFQKYLRNELVARGMRIGVIEHRPINGLMTYHNN